MALVAQKHFLKYQEREGCVAFPLLEMYFAKRCPVSPPEFECLEVSGLCNFFFLPFPGLFLKLAPRPLTRSVVADVCFDGRCTLVHPEKE